MCHLYYAVAPSQLRFVFLIIRLITTLILICCTLSVQAIDDVETGLLITAVPNLHSPYNSTLFHV